MFTGHGAMSVSSTQGHKIQALQRKLASLINHTDKLMVQQENPKSKPVKKGEEYSKKILIVKFCSFGQAHTRNHSVTGPHMTLPTHITSHTTHTPHKQSVSGAQQGCRQELALGNVY